MLIFCSFAFFRFLGTKKADGLISVGFGIFVVYERYVKGDVVNGYYNPLISRCHKSSVTRMTPDFK